MKAKKSGEFSRKSTTRRPRSEGSNEDVPRHIPILLLLPVKLAKSASGKQNGKRWGGLALTPIPSWQIDRSEGVPYDGTVVGRTTS